MYPNFTGLHWATSYGVFLVTSLTLWWWLSRRQARRAGLDCSHVDLLTPLIILGGMLGAKLFSIISPNDIQVSGDQHFVAGRLRLFGWILLGLIVMAMGTRWIEFLLPPVVTGAIVMTIGLNLAPVAVSSVAGSNFDAAMALVTILCIGLAAVLTRGMLQRLLILVGLVAAYAIYALVTNGLGWGTAQVPSLVAALEYAEAHCRPKDAEGKEDAKLTLNLRRNEFTAAEEAQLRAAIPQNSTSLSSLNGECCASTHT